MFSGLNFVYFSFFTQDAGAALLKPYILSILYLPSYNMFFFFFNAAIRRVWRDVIGKVTWRHHRTKLKILFPGRSPQWPETREMAHPPLPRWDLIVFLCSCSVRTAGCLSLEDFFKLFRRVISFHHLFLFLFFCPTLFVCPKCPIVDWIL
jgi:hypothetical protein